MTHTRYVYADCHICGGHVIEATRRKEHYWKNKAAVFHDVPAGVCQKCRTPYYRPEVRKRLDELTQRPPANAQFVSVPLVRYAHVPRDL